MAAKKKRVIKVFSGDKSLLSYTAVWICLLTYSCNSTSDKPFVVVTHQEFETFVEETGYVTDAEKFGWSIVQQDVYNFITVEGANWRKPDGRHAPASKNLPVTQVSYNDAIAYCKWSGAKLPSYNQYWELIKDDNRMVVTNYNAPISTADEVNILGNVWEITASEIGGQIRLAGGSVFCSPSTCHGTRKERKLFVDKQTGNIHIGFAVIEQ